MLKATIDDMRLSSDLHHLLRELFTNILASNFRVVENVTTFYRCKYQK